MYKNIDIWLTSYIRQGRRRKKGGSSGLRHIMFSVVDHFEPFWGNRGTTRNVARNPAEIRNRAEDRVNTWVERYPNLAKRHRDSDGRFPQHTFFYPSCFVPSTRC